MTLKEDIDRAAAGLIAAWQRVADC